MGNPTKVFFYREDVIMSQVVDLTTAGSHFHFRLPTFIDACLDQARFYAEQGKDTRDILSTAVNQILGENSSQKVDSIYLNSLDTYGVREITTFSRSSVFQDVRIIAAEIVESNSHMYSPLMYSTLQAWIWSSHPRIPQKVSPFRLLLKNIVCPGMFFFEREEVDQIVKAAEPVIDQFTFDIEWQEVIQAHTSSEYDLALFYSLV